MTNSDYSPDPNAYPDKTFMWVDDRGVRCGPRHRSIKLAINYRNDCMKFKDEPPTDGNTMNERQQWRSFQKGRKDYPSQDLPVKLVIGEWSMRDMTESEDAAFRQVLELVSNGWL